jgi:UDP-N-acetylmuramoyl-L-alanyl-D-glutamate--2,6-diaminopimelate ligase
MRLDQLLPAFGLEPALASLWIRGVENDSRRVLPDTLFLACRGGRVDGADYIPEAERRGALAVLVEAGRCDLPASNIPVIEVPQLTNRVPELAARFYREPSEALHVIGITGTNGKTSCSHFIATAMAQLGTKTGVIGTNGLGFIGALETATHTTPDALHVQHALAKIKDQGAVAVSMEVSSHALDQGRVVGVNFKQGVFTNLTRDHLDYHGDMEAYGAAKALLFSHHGVEQAIINWDDPYGRLLLESLPNTMEGIGYSLTKGSSDIHVISCAMSTEGIEADIGSPWGALRIKSALLGVFNLSNLLATLGVLGGQGYAVDEIAAALSNLSNVEGRMQRIGGEGQPLIVVDYAHTPDALEQALEALRPHCEGRLWCVFGCGGDRDRGKRPLMGRVAQRLSDYLVVTSDNPRSEVPERIIDGILGGIDSHSLGADRLMVEVDRETAIRMAVSRAEPQDMVLVAGKGHENYQEIKGVKHSFSDAKSIESALNEREA